MSLSIEDHSRLRRSRHASAVAGVGIGFESQLSVGFRRKIGIEPVVDHLLAGGADQIESGSL